MLRLLLGVPVGLEFGIYEAGDALAVFLQRVERVLHGLVDGLLDVLAHVLDLVHAAARLKHKHIERCENTALIASDRASQSCKTSPTALLQPPQTTILGNTTRVFIGLKLRLRTLHKRQWADGN